MGLLYTMSAFLVGGVSSRVLALGLQGKAVSSELGTSIAWTSVWLAAGYSFNQWREKQELEYVKRLQYFVDRKGREGLGGRESDDHYETSERKLWPTPCQLSIKRHESYECSPCPKHY